MEQAGDTTMTSMPSEDIAIEEAPDTINGGLTPFEDAADHQGTVAKTGCGTVGLYAVCFVLGAASLVIAFAVWVWNSGTNSPCQPNAFLLAGKTGLLVR
jgi:hypothetical protein